MKHPPIICLLAALLLTSACSTTSGPPKRSEPIHWTESYNKKVVAPRRNSPAILVKSESDIDKSQFVEVGQPYTATLVKACFNGQCKNYDTKRPSVDRLLEEAAQIGATHLLLDKQDFVIKQSVSRDTDECGVSERYKGGVYTHYDAAGNYTSGRGVFADTKPRCQSWASEWGEGEYIGLRGTAWRYDPQAAATLRKLNNVVIPHIVTDKNTGKCSYVEPLFNSSVASNGEVCFPYFKFEDKAYAIEASYYALYSVKGYDGEIRWKVLNMHGFSEETLFSKAPSCAQNDAKCLGKFIKLELRRRRY